MLQSFFRYPLLAMAFSVCSPQATAQATESSSAYLVAGGQAVRSSSGDCWRTAAWTRERATPECDPDAVTYWAEVRFGFEGDELRADGRKVLDALAQRLLAANPERVALTAYTDRVGEAAYNARLSKRRAAAIRAYLIDKGVPEKLMRAESRGSRDPVTAGQCDAMGSESRRNTKLIACLQPDRRVEVEATVRPR
jgi:OOP family OmpA-OmpF porin